MISTWSYRVYPDASKRLNAFSGRFRLMISSSPSNRRARASDLYSARTLTSPSFDVCKSPPPCGCAYMYSY